MIKIAIMLLINTVCLSSTIELGSEPLLFIDDYAIASMTGISRTLHPAQKLDYPVLVPNEYEGSSIYITNAVYNRQNSVFKMWYRGRGGTRCAVSTDGINFSRYPSTAPIFYKGAGALVIDGDIPNYDKTYKMFGSNGSSQFWGAYSDDGLIWHEFENNPVIDFGSEIISIFKDPVNDYLLFVRPYLPSHEVNGNVGRRLIALSATSEFNTFTPLEVILAPDAIDDQWTEPNSDQRTEFYSMSGFKYGSHYLGLLQVFNVTEIIPLADIVSGQSRYEGPIYTQLVYSLDGFNWNRYEDRSPIIELGHEGSFDAGCIMNVADKPVIFGDEIYYYYTAINTTHGGSPDAKEITIGLAKWRLDGYVSLDAADTQAVITTKPMELQANRLSLNADAEYGSIRVEILDASTGLVVQGFSTQDCEPVTTDSVNHIVRWNGNSEIPALSNVVLRFTLQNSSLYSIKAPSIPINCEHLWTDGYGYKADLNKDCKVDIMDFLIFSQNWMQTD